MSNDPLYRLVKRMPIEPVYYIYFENLTDELINRLDSLDEKLYKMQVVYKYGHPENVQSKVMVFKLPIEDTHWWSLYLSDPSKMVFHNFETGEIVSNPDNQSRDGLSEIITVLRK